MIRMEFRLLINIQLCPEAYNADWLQETLLRELEGTRGINRKRTIVSSDRLLDPPHQPLEGLVRWVCDEPASLTPESVLTGTKERREKLLTSFRANGFHGVVKLPLGFKNH